MNHVDLFSGIGGFALAAEWAGFETIVFCEKDDYCQKILKKHWPGVPIIAEIRDFKWPLANSVQERSSPEQDKQSHKSPSPDHSTGSSSNGQITLLTGGFPCQPFSVAGKRRGKEDDRYLWPEMFRVISEVRPTWVLAENVTGIINMELDKCLSDLEGEGYETETFIIPACAVDAKHRRERVWIVAHSNTINDGSCEAEKHKQGKAKFQNRKDGITSTICGTLARKRNRSQNVADSKLSTKRPTFGKRGDKRRTDGQQEDRNGLGNDLRNGGQARSWEACFWPAEPDVGRVAHGVSARVDRLKALGNAIVPQVAYEIIRVIKTIEERK